MNILTELTALLSPILPIETGVFTDIPPDEYMVITPMVDILEGFADNQPHSETQEVRLSLLCKGNYLGRKNEVTKALLAAEFTITGRRYIGYETDTGYHHYNIDTAKNYELN